MNGDKYYRDFERWNMCVLIPTYNHGGTVSDVIRGMLDYTDSIIVVNDGSSDNTKEALVEYEERLTVIHLPKNRGKGEALRTGFNFAISKGYDRCMTIDSDGQHFPDDVPLFLDAIELNPDGLFMGTRTLDHKDVPGASTFGNKFANFWYWVITSRKLKDTQSGFRVYPLMRMKNMKFYSHRYEYEAEILIRLSWRDMPIVPVPIKVYYAPGDLRISHFKKVKDFTRITLLNIYLLIIALVYWHPVMFLRKFKKKSFKDVVKEHILSSDHSNARLTVALMVGVFFGVAPLWGFQMLAILGVCVLFNLNKPLSLLSAQISLPPFIPFILYTSYLVGGWFLGTFTSLTVHEVDLSNAPTLHELKNSAVQYVIGAVVLGLILAAFTGVVSLILLNIFRKKGRVIQMKEDYN